MGTVTREYIAFGECWQSQGTLPTDKLFTGQRLDSTGLYYFNARYYDPNIGRFISADTQVPDPSNPQYLNRYSYCLNNPLRYTDPTGHGLGDWFSSIGQDISNAWSSVTTTVESVNWGAVGQTAYDVGTIAATAAVVVLGAAEFLDSGVPIVMDNAAAALPEEAGQIEQAASEVLPAAQEASTAISNAAPELPAAASEVTSAVEEESSLPTKLYHYTSADPASIMKEGLQPGSSGNVYTTPAGNLSPGEAQQQLALPQASPPTHLIEIDVPTLQKMGIQIPSSEPVSPAYNMTGGGTQVVFPRNIPPDALTVVR